MRQPTVKNDTANRDKDGIITVRQSTVKTDTVNPDENGTNE